MTMAATNRPYMFELAALVVNGQDLDGGVRKKAAQANGVDAADLDRAIAIVRVLQQGGEDPRRLRTA